jgi:hypothetical protein
MIRPLVIRGALGLSVALAACSGQTSRPEESAMAAPVWGQPGDSAQAVARACDLARTYALREPAAQCRVERFLSTPEEYVIRVRIDLPAKRAPEITEVRLAKEKPEATVVVIPIL